MYALTCPACDHVRNVPFVRPGAATQCPACQHQWTIKERQVKREDRPVSPQAVADLVPPLTPPRSAKAAGLDALDDDPKGGSSVSGLSGLSDLMQDVPKPKAKPSVATRRPKPATRAVKSTPAAATGVGRVGTGAWIWIGLGLVAAALLVVFAIAQTNPGGGDGAGTPNTNTATPPPPAPTDRPTPATP